MCYNVNKIVFWRKCWSRSDELPHLYKRSKLKELVPLLPKRKQSSFRKFLVLKISIENQLVWMESLKKPKERVARSIQVTCRVVCSIQYDFSIEIPNMSFGSFECKRFNHCVINTNRYYIAGYGNEGYFVPTFFFLSISFPFHKKLNVECFVHHCTKWS